MQKRLTDRHITLQLDDTAKNWLADNGYNEEFGARPLKRLIVQQIENPLSILLLDGAIADNSKVFISANANGLNIQPEK